MADSTETKRDQALEFLDELDGKHDHLLTELDALNARIDTILREYTKSRQAAGQLAGTHLPNGRKPEPQVRDSCDSSSGVCCTSSAALKEVSESQLAVANDSTATMPSNSN